MPWRAFRCVVNLTLNEVTAPGVWLPSQEDVFLSVSLFGQYQTTRQLFSIFPLLVYEELRFEKTYYTASDLAEVADYLHDEVVIFELVQLSDYSDGAVRLASFSSSAGDFLRPFPSHAGSTCTDHEILLSRTIAFNGISPQLSFSTRTLIKESLSPELDALEDALQEEKERRIFNKTHRVPTRRARSAKNVSSSSRNISTLSYIPNEDDPPPRYRQHTKSSLSRCRSVSLPNSSVDVDLSNTTDSRPVFVVHRPKEELIRRVPGGAHANCKASASKKDKMYREKSKSQSKHKKERKKAKSSVSGGQVASSHGRGKWLCSECRAYQKATGRPCIGLGSFHRECSHSSCRCYHRLIHGSLHRQPTHLHFSDDEDETIYVTRRHPRSASSPMRYRTRFEYYPPPPVIPFYSPPDRIRLMPHYESSWYDLEL